MHLYKIDLITYVLINCVLKQKMLFKTFHGGQLNILSFKKYTQCQITPRETRMGTPPHGKKDVLPQASMLATQRRH